MTRFVGILDLARARRASADGALSSIVARPGEALHRWSDANASFVQATLATTPEAATEALPFRNAAGQVIVGDMRLDNCDELHAALGVAHGDRAAMGDGALVLAAYSRWGMDCAAHLLGDFAFAIWDPAERRLLCFSDPYAMRPLFHHFDGKRFVFASTPQLIHAAGVAARPNLDKFAALAGPEALGLFADESWYADIGFLGGGMALVVDRQGVKPLRYWEPARGAPLRFKDDRAFREAFQPILFDAVRSRLRSNVPVTALLSGGLDSSSVVAVAAKILERDNRELDVLSVVLPDEQDPVFTDEREYIDLFRAFPNIRINHVIASGKGPFSDLDAFDWSNGPLHTSRHFLYADIARQCAALGSNAVLDGVGGEYGVSLYGRGFQAELFRTMRWPSLWRELRATEALSEVPIASQFRSQVLRPLLPARMRRGRAPSSDVTIHGMGIFPPGFEERLRQRIEALRGSVPTRHIGSSHRANQLNLLRLRHIRGIHSMFPGGALETRYPLLDRRLLQFCLDAPGSFKVRNGYSRSIARIGLEGLLPPKIQWRTTKKPFSPDYLRRYSAQAADAVRYLEAIAPNDPVREVIDVDRVLGYARIAVADDERDRIKEQHAMHRVPLAIYSIEYLRQFGEFRG